MGTGELFNEFKILRDTFPWWPTIVYEDVHKIFLRQSHIIGDIIFREFNGRILAEILDNLLVAYRELNNDAII